MLKAEKERNVVFSEYRLDKKEESKKEFPFEIRKVEENVNRKLLQDFTGNTHTKNLS